jgi:hypothetical protein
MLDSTTARAHQQAVTGRKKGFGRDEFLISLCIHDAFGQAGDSYVRYSLMRKWVTHHDTGAWNCMLGSAGFTTLI